MFTAGLFTSVSGCGVRTHTKPLAKVGVSSATAAWLQNITQGRAHVRCLAVNLHGFSCCGWFLLRLVSGEVHICYQVGVSLSGVKEDCLRRAATLA